MKYIRTEDGRISYLIREPNEEMTDYEIITSKGTLTYRREDEVIKVADTIEELCDAFVEVRNVGDELPFIVPKHYLDNYRVLEQFGGLTKSKITRQVYGAIWTSKGLIYVAKMNDKGELELL